MSKPSSPRPSTKAMSSSWTIWPPTRARPPRRPSRPGVHGSYSCHPIALTSIQSKWPSQSLKPISAQKPSGPSMPSGRRSGTSAISSSLQNAKTTSPPLDMDSAERPALYSGRPLCNQKPALCTERSPSLGNYTGHDEPSLLFYSNVPGSGNSNVYVLTLPNDPPNLPKQDGTGGTFNFQLHPAFWFGMAMCDTQSAPNPGQACPPDSDSNIFDGADPTKPD